jgi:tripartite-type tricarboxylate transporter receptor subunit TctC
MNHDSRNMTRRQGLALIGVAASTLALSAFDVVAQSFPTRSLRVVLPVGPGSGLDARAREVTQKLSELLAQQVVVENRPGAGGIIAMNLLAKAPADGYTLALAGIAPVAYYSALYRKLPFTPDDFAPVSLLATGPSSIYASPEFAPRSVAELVTHAKGKPGQLSFASQGVGTFQHLAGEWFKLAAGVDLLHVPYKEYGQILSDLGSGRVSLLFDSTGAVLGHVQGGKLKAFAVTGAQRLGSLPQVPTFAEAGLPAYEPSINYGVFAPAGTPPAVVESLSLACAKVQRSKEIQDSLARFGFSSQGSTPAEFASYIASERERWIKVVRASGAQLEY